MIFQQQKNHTEWDLDPPTSKVNSDFWRKKIFATPLNTQSMILCSNIITIIYLKTIMLFISINIIMITSTSTDVTNHYYYWC